MIEASLASIIIALDGLKNFLLKNGLHYGYAKFWYAGVLSVLSDEKLLVRQVVFDQGLPKPDRWLSSAGLFGSRMDIPSLLAPSQTTTPALAPRPQH